MPQLSRQRGFNLIEVSLLILLLGFLITAGFIGLGTLHTQEKYRQTKLQISDIKLDLLAYLEINQFLPCPDTDGNGLENRRTNGTCQQNSGWLPFLELGGKGYRDAFGNRFIYSVNTNATSNTATGNLRFMCRSASLFARQGSISNTLWQCPNQLSQFCSETQCQKACGITACIDSSEVRMQPPYFSLITPPLGTSTARNGALKVCNPNATTCTDSTALTKVEANLVPAVIMSRGTQPDSDWQTCQSQHPQEQENCDGDAYFYQGEPATGFRHLINWISIHEAKIALQP